VNVCSERDAAVAEMMATTSLLNYQAVRGAFEPFSKTTGEQLAKRARHMAAQAKKKAVRRESACSTRESTGAILRASLFEVPRALS